MNTNIIREEDIFYLYERNRNYYINCSTPDICKKNCLCYYNQIIIPNSIGNKDFKRTINNKMYISPNETCIVCMSKINKKSDAYITDCGHSFHKFCLSSYFQYINFNTNKNLKCPMCRCNLGYPEFYEKYNMQYKNTNGLDMLENVDIMSYNMLHMCKNTTINSSHYLGINKNCKKCLQYRKNGKY